MNVRLGSLHRVTLTEPQDRTMKALWRLGFRYSRSCTDGDQIMTKWTSPKRMRRAAVDRDGLVNGEPAEAYMEAL